MFGLQPLWRRRCLRVWLYTWKKYMQVSQRTSWNTLWKRSASVFCHLHRWADLSLIFNLPWTSLLRIKRLKHYRWHPKKIARDRNESCTAEMQQRGASKRKSFDEAICMLRLMISWAWNCTSKNYLCRLYGLYMIQMWTSFNRTSRIILLTQIAKPQT